MDDIYNEVFEDWKQVAGWHGVGEAAACGLLLTWIDNNDKLGIERMRSQLRDIDAKLSELAGYEPSRDSRAPALYAHVRALIKGSGENEGIEGLVDRQNARIVELEEGLAAAEDKARALKGELAKLQRRDRLEGRRVLQAIDQQGFKDKWVDHLVWKETGGRQGAPLSLSGYDCRGLALSGLDMSSCDLSRSDFSGCDMSGCDLRRADLSRAVLKGCDLSGSLLNGARLWHSVCQGATFTNAELFVDDLSYCFDFNGVFIGDAIVSAACLFEGEVCGISKAERIWDSLADCPVAVGEGGDVVIDDDFLIWAKGTSRDEVWRVLDEKHPGGVASLLGEAVAGRPAVRQATLSDVATQAHGPSKASAGRADAQKGSVQR